MKIIKLTVLLGAFMESTSMLLRQMLACQRVSLSWTKSMLFRQMRLKASGKHAANYKVTKRASTCTKTFNSSCSNSSRSPSAEATAKNPKKKTTILIQNTPSGASQCVDFNHYVFIRVYCSVHIGSYQLSTPPYTHSCVGFSATMLLSDVEMAMRYHNLRVLMCLRLTAPQLLGMVKTEEPLDSDVISNIQWECEKIEIIGREMAFTSCCSCGPKGNGQAKGLSNTMLCHLTKMSDQNYFLELGKRV